MSPSIFGSKKIENNKMSQLTTFRGLLGQSNVRRNLYKHWDKVQTLPRARDPIKLKVLILAKFCSASQVNKPLIDISVVTLPQMKQMSVFRLLYSLLLQILKYVDQIPFQFYFSWMRSSQSGKARCFIRSTYFDRFGQSLSMSSSVNGENLAIDTNPKRTQSTSENLGK